MNRITEADVEKELVIQMAPKARRLIALKERSAGADDISPGMRLMLITLRRALLQICSAIETYLGSEGRRRD
jgi:hypothetical protein